MGRNVMLIILASEWYISITNIILCKISNLYSIYNNNTGINLMERLIHHIESS
jgi:hypothetical protein